MFLIALCFVVNMAVTFSVAWAIGRNGVAISEAFGPDAPARRILACVYLAIGVVSLYGFLQLGYGRTESALEVAWILFPLQILYKLLTVVAVGIKNQVVLANLAIVMLLCTALALAP